MFKLVVPIILISQSLPAQSVSKVFQKVKNKSNYSIDIRSADGKVIFQHQADKKLIPASLTKLAVLGAAADTYPMNWKFNNQLLAKVSPTSGVLNGDLCFKASGDPSFVAEKMWYLINQLHRKNIRKIKGDLLIDTSVHDDSQKDSGRTSVRVSRAYDAPVSAASFNWNSVNIFMSPGNKVGDKAKVYLGPRNDYFVLDNEIKTVRGKQSNLKQRIKLERSKKGKRTLLKLNGKIGIQNEEEVIYRNIRQPEKWLAYNLLEFMSQRDINLNGEIKVETCKGFSQVLAEQESKDIVLIYRDMMKFSNNFVTEMLVKSMPTIKGKQGSFVLGKKIVDTYLKDLGISGYQLRSVSGLSRNNRFSANDFSKVLLDLRQSTYSYELLQSLPLAGLDGTLKGRLRGLPKDQVVRAKTGLLSGVVGLAGLVQDGDKEYIVSMIYNGKKHFAAKKVMDDIIRDLL